MKKLQAFALVVGFVCLGLLVAWSTLTLFSDGDLVHAATGGTVAQGDTVTGNHGVESRPVSIATDLVTSKDQRHAMAQGIANLDSGYPTSVGYSEAHFALATISNVRINGGDIGAPVGPGADVAVSFDWSMEGSGGVIQQIQLGFPGLGEPTHCIDVGIGSHSGSETIILTAPISPGSHIVAFDRGQDWGCFVSHDGWWNGNPLNDPRRYMAVATTAEDAWKHIFLPLVLRNQ